MLDSCTKRVLWACKPLVLSRCVTDTKPRSMDTEQMALLCNFAEMAVREMEKDKLCTLQRGNSLAAEMTADGMHRAVKALTEGLFVIDVLSPGWKILLMNEQAEDFAGGFVNLPRPSHFGFGVLSFAVVTIQVSWGLGSSQMLELLPKSLGV